MTRGFCIYFFIFFHFYLLLLPCCMGTRMYSSASVLPSSSVVDDKLETIRELGEYGRNKQLNGVLEADNWGGVAEHGLAGHNSDVMQVIWGKGIIDLFV